MNMFQSQVKAEQETSIYVGESTPFQANPIAILTQIRSCSKRKDLLKGIRIHTYLLKHDLRLLEKDIYVGSALVGLYAKCCQLSKAREVLDSLPCRNVVSWTSLISGYTQHGMAKEALICFEEMQHEGLSPDAFTLVCALKACGFMGDIEKGEEIHTRIASKRFLSNNVIVGTALIDMYAKFGALEKAQEVFDGILVKDVFTWTVLMSGYVQHGRWAEALHYFERFQVDGHSLDASTFVCILKACGGLGLVEKGTDVHAMIIREGLLQKNVLVGTALVDMYARCGALSKAQEVFDELPARDLVSWTILLDGYTLHGYTERALECYEELRIEGLSPDAVVFVCVLKACGNMGSLEVKGREIHAEIAREGFLEKSMIPVGNALMDMYAKSGALSRAQEVFNELCFRDVVSWNTLISGYAEFGSGEDALSLFEHMQREGLPATVATFLGALQACGKLSQLEKGIEIHSQIEQNKLIENNILIASALVDMYTKCGALAKALKVFSDIVMRDVFTWNALTWAYVQCGDGEKAFECFRRMQCEGVLPDAVTYVCILQACADTVDLRKGTEIHAEISQLKHFDTTILNGLLYMYSKCGALEDTQIVFDEIPFYDVVSWTALISGYAEVGEVETALELFNNMLRQGIKPNSVTFTVILNACRHSGLLKEGQMCFEIMIRCHFMAPTSEQYTCMVDLFGRAGHFDKALAVIQTMPMSDYLSAWTVMLGACQKWGNVELAKLAFKHVIWLDPTHEAAYICMNNIFAAAEMQKNEEEGHEMKDGA